MNKPKPNDTIEGALWRLGNVFGIDIPSDGTIADKINFLADANIGLNRVITEKVYGPKRFKYAKPFLNEVWYSSLDYDGAIRYFEGHDGFKPMACSSVRKGNFYGRNFDWFYDNNTEYVVHTDHAGGRYSTVGIAANAPENAGMSLVPFFLTDGINEHGLVCNMNVVPNDYGNTVSVPSGEIEETVNGLMLVRCILDNFKTADEAIERIQSHVSVWFPKYLHNMGYELHYMIADSNKTYILEFVENEAVVIEANQMTNFHLYGVTPNDDGTVYTPYTQDDTHNAIDTNGVTANGAGLERWNVIADAYDDIQDADDMRNLMTSLNYTNSYTRYTAADIWFTEFVGDGRTCASSPSEFVDALNEARYLYGRRSRETADTWQTTHSAVYDMQNKTLNLVVQEDEEELTYTI